MRHLNADVIESIAAETRQTIGAAIGAAGGESGVALLDFPSYQNVGDTMIWLGELQHLERLSVPVHYASDHKRFDPAAVSRLAPEVPILLTGGGNFGDLWPEYQAFREHVAERFPDRRIVHLPQSIWFDSPANAARANQVFARHPDFMLLLRDDDSMERAAQQLPDVRIDKCPDAAFGIGPIDHTRRGERPVLLLRRDREKLAGGDGLDGIAGERQDWGLSGVDQLAWKAVRIPGRVHASLPDAGRRALYPSVELGYRAMGALNMRAAIRLYSTANAILTDRLHAHVLAGLMGLPHVVIDNSYGKIGAAFREYSGRLELAEYAATAHEGAAKFRALQERLTHRAADPATAARRAN